MLLAVLIAAALEMTAAEDWTWVSTHEGGQNFMDRASIRQVGRLRFATIKGTANTGPVEYYLFNRAFDCEGQSTALTGGTIAYRDGRRENETFPESEWRFRKESKERRKAGWVDLEMVCSAALASDKSPDEATH